MWADAWFYDSDIVDKGWELTRRVLLEGMGQRFILHYDERAHPVDWCWTFVLDPITLLHILLLALFESGSFGGDTNSQGHGEKFFVRGGPFVCDGRYVVPELRLSGTADLSAWECGGFQLDDQPMQGFKICDSFNRTKF